MQSVNYSSFHFSRLSYSKRKVWFHIHKKILLRTELCNARQGFISMKINVFALPAPLPNLSRAETVSILSTQPVLRNGMQVKSIAMCTKAVRIECGKVSTYGHCHHAHLKPSRFFRVMELMAQKNLYWDFVRSAVNRIKGSVSVCLQGIGKVHTDRKEISDPF